MEKRHANLTNWNVVQSGWIESFVMNYVRELTKQGVQFDFISMFPKLAYEDEITALGGKVYHTVDGRKRPITFYRQMKKILRMRHYDAVHVNMLSAANIVPVMTARHLGVKKVIAHSHNSSTPGLVRNLLHRVNKPFLSCFATDYFACSQVAAEWLFTGKVLKSGKVRLIHNALRLEDFLCSEMQRAEAKKQFQLEDKFVIGHVGRFEEQKNHLYLIEIMKAFTEKRDDVVLLLIGTGRVRNRSAKEGTGIWLGETGSISGTSKGCSGTFESDGSFSLSVLV